MVHRDCIWKAKDETEAEDIQDAEKYEIFCVRDDQMERQAD